MLISNGLCQSVSCRAISGHLILDQFVIHNRILALVNVQTYQQTARHYVFLFFESVITRFTSSTMELYKGSESHIFGTQKKLLTSEYFNDLFLCAFVDLRSMSSDFVFGFIQCLDGEKDPR